MGEFWGFVDWGAGCLALIVAVVFRFLLGVRTGRIRERNESSVLAFGRIKRICIAINNN